MMTVLHKAFNIYAVIGFGGLVAIAAVVVGIMFPRFLYVAMIVAACAVAGTSVYSKGVYDEYKLRQQRELNAAHNALKTESAALSDAVRAERAEHANPSWVRDPYDRDRSKGSTTAKPSHHRASGVCTVAPHPVFKH
jgi:hypothetical protein